jgi:hypothetical protein
MIQVNERAAFRYRGHSAGVSTTLGEPCRFSLWVRLIRRGDQITGYCSENGTDWQEMGTANVHFDGMATDRPGGDSALTTMPCAPHRWKSEHPRAGCDGDEQSYGSARVEALRRTILSGEVRPRIGDSPLPRRRKFPFHRRMSRESLLCRPAPASGATGQRAAGNWC